MPKVILIDNYDSFTYNILQCLTNLGAQVLVFKNDEIDLPGLIDQDFSHLVISPGPGDPTVAEDFGICTEAIKYFAGKLPILGVCLGHQGIAAIYGGKVIKAPTPVHGMREVIRQTEFGLKSKLFRNLPKEFEVMRYHSLVVDRKSFPADFKITAETIDYKLIMAFEHVDLPIYGVQFHPESIGSPLGEKILQNFIE
jgi:anthranilate synthase/aminodeoxychorismate synthase-like glutamine amidotransferase